MNTALAARAWLILGYLDVGVQIISLAVIFVFTPSGPQAGPSHGIDVSACFHVCVFVCPHILSIGWLLP